MDDSRVKKRYRLTLSVSGRVRFLSHLETVDTLLGAMRRANLTVALSNGMKPKPRISMTMPRPVGVEGWAEPVEVELLDPPSPEAVREALSATLPRGVVVSAAEEVALQRRYLASFVEGATYRFVFDELAPLDVADASAAVDAYLARTELIIERRTPKQHHDVDVRSHVTDMEVVDTDNGVDIRFYIPLSDGGTARPTEVLTALGVAAGAPLPQPLVVRESIAASSDTGGINATPALVGADTPPEPQKPWGAC